MALLTNTDLKGIVIDNIDSAAENNLVIAPFEKENLTPVGYDLRVGKSYVTDGSEKELSENNELRIGSKEMALIHSLEEIRMPSDKKLSALIHSKVSLSCKGLSSISTTVDADWKGHLLIAVHNDSNKTISLKYGEAFCTILFIENKSAANEGKYAKPDGRSDILKNAFKNNNKKNYFVTFFVNSIPPLFSVLIFFVANLYSEGKPPYFVPSGVAVGIFISGYMSQFTTRVAESITRFFTQNKI